MPPHLPAPRLELTGRRRGGGGVGGINLGLLATQGPPASKGGGGGRQRGAPLIPFPDFLCGLPLTLDPFLIMAFCFFLSVLVPIAFLPSARP